jgi:hypothetical protein
VTLLYGPVSLYQFSLSVSPEAIYSNQRPWTYSYFGKIWYGETLLFGFLLFAWLWFNGQSLRARSRSAFIAPTVVVLLPLAGAPNLLRLFVHGTWLTANWLTIILHLIGWLQPVATGIILRHLFARQTRDYIGKPTA